MATEAEVLEAIRSERLTTAELAGVADLWFGCRPIRTSSSTNPAETPAFNVC